MGDYRTIVADPPWQQSGGPLTSGVGEGFVFDGPQRSRPLAYTTMSVAEIAALPVAELAAADADLYLWTTNAYVEHVHDVARAWGFRPSTLLVWAKETMGGGLGGPAFGISTEFLLYATRGSPRPVNRQPRTWFAWKRRYDDRGKPLGSAKPLESYGMIEDTSPGPYVELFSRERRPRLGWDYWGNESIGTAAMPVAADG
jgi:N6-adenosine-specific RNA methylase IME4